MSEPTIDRAELITTAEAAAITGHKRNSVISWITTGDLIPVAVVGRTRLVRRADVLAVAAKKAQHQAGGPRAKREEAPKDQQLVLPGV